VRLYPCDVYLKGAGRGAGSGKLRSGKARGGVWASAASVAPVSIIFLLASAWALNAIEDLRQAFVEDLRSFGSHTRRTVMLAPALSSPAPPATLLVISPIDAYTKIGCTRSRTKEHAHQGVRAHVPTKVCVHGAHVLPRLSPCMHVSTHTWENMHKDAVACRKGT
jgi:hypothetical protein